MASCSSATNKTAPFLQKLYQITVAGLVPYNKALSLQKSLVKTKITRQADNTVPDLVIYLQHRPTYTAGRRLFHMDKALIASECERLRSLGADVEVIERGGLWTFHGPGQLIAYPLVDLKRSRITPRCYVSALEQCMIDTCADFGLEGRRTSDTGVWIGNNKIGAIGIQIQEGVTMHGLALNCDTDLAWFSHIVPCGISDKGVTSLSKELARNVPVEQVISKLNRNLARALNVPAESGVATLSDHYPDLAKEIKSQLI